MATRCGLPERGWLSVNAAASYVGLSPDVLRRAIAAGDLPAYAKPATYRRGTGERQRALVSVADVDAWVRSQPRVTYGPEVTAGLTEVA